jgi:small nuclear ribonucleoprotein E
MATTTAPKRSGPKLSTPPINMIYRFLSNRMRVQVWLYERPETRLEGLIRGFDEYMNVVLDDVEEVNVKKQTRKPLGRILLKGDNITLIRGITSSDQAMSNQ